VELGGLVTLWQEKMATKTLKHEDFTKEKRSKILNLTALPVRDGIPYVTFDFYPHSIPDGISYLPLTFGNSMPSVISFYLPISLIYFVNRESLRPW
jgi:hypothetical protein